MKLALSTTFLLIYSFLPAVLASEDDPVNCGLGYELIPGNVFPQATDAGCGCVVELGDNGKIQEKDTAVVFSSDADSSSEDDDLIINCNACGKCSNCHDIGIYATSARDMSGNIFSQLFDFQCALVYIITKLGALAIGIPESQAIAQGEVEARHCLSRNTALIDTEGLGFSEPCLDCWVEAVRCTPEVCVTYDENYTPIGGPCQPLLAYFQTPEGQMFNGDLTTLPQDLQDSFGGCLICDALHCSPPFVECAGASRRTIGRDSPALTSIASLLGQPTCTKALDDNVCGLEY